MPPFPISTSGCIASVFNHKSGKFRLQTGALFMRTILNAAMAIGLTIAPAAADELTVITAGDQNMVDYINQYLGPLFEKENPGTTVRVVGTGPGDAGSQKVLERFEAQSKAGVEKWDTDVAVVHEKFVGPMVTAKFLENYRSKIDSGKLVTRENA